MTGQRPYDPRVTEGTQDPRQPAAEPDPWKDAPRWSDPVADPWPGAPATSDAGPPASPDAGASGAPSVAAREVAAADAGANCPWCSTPAPPGATRCSSCGAALAQRQSIGELVVPGLTVVDPALQDYAERPLHLRGPSPSHGVASGAIAAAAIGGPLGLAIIGGVAAVAAAEYIGAGREGPDGVPLDQVGQASGAVLQAIEKLERGEPLPSSDVPTRTPAQRGAQEETGDGGD